jgi:hypothetical protein
MGGRGRAGVFEDAREDLPQQRVALAHVSQRILKALRYAPTSSHSHGSDRSSIARRTRTHLGDAQGCLQSPAGLTRTGSEDLRRLSPIGDPGFLGCPPLTGTISQLFRNSFSSTTALSLPKSSNESRCRISTTTANRSCHTAVLCRSLCGLSRAAWS